MLFHETRLARCPTGWLNASAKGWTLKNYSQRCGMALSDARIFISQASARFYHNLGGLDEASEELCCGQWLLTVNTEFFCELNILLFFKSVLMLPIPSYPSSVNNTPTGRHRAALITNCCIQNTDCITAGVDIYLYNFYTSRSLPPSSMPYFNVSN